MGHAITGRWRWKRVRSPHHSPHQCEHTHLAIGRPMLKQQSQHVRLRRVEQLESRD